MKNNNKLVGKIVVILLTVILGGLTIVVGFLKALATVVVGILAGFVASLVIFWVVFLVLYLHYLFGNNTYRDFDQYLDDL